MKVYDDLIGLAKKHGLSEECLNSAIIHRGNNNRIKRFIEKAKNGDTVTIGFLGGSITYGSNSTDGKCFVNLVIEWLGKLFPDAKINLINAGFGGTGSIVGFYRMDNELLQYNPDLTFIDFTVNDALENKRDGVVPNESYEGVIRRTLESNSAVVILGFCDKDKTTFRDNHFKVARHYDLSFISMVDSIFKMIESKALKWEEYSNDSVHPINSGHEMIALLIEYFLIKEINSITDNTYNIPSQLNNHILKRPCTFDFLNLPTNDYGSFNKYDDYLRLKNGFVSRGDLPICFHLNEVKELFLIILYSNDSNTGNAVVEIGNEKKTINCYFKDGWGSKPLAVNVFSSDEPKNIDVRISSETKNKNIIILRICKS